MPAPDTDKFPAPPMAPETVIVSVGLVRFTTVDELSVMGAVMICGPAKSLRVAFDDPLSMMRDPPVLCTTATV